MRVRTAAVGGLVEDNPLAAAATTLTSAGLSALPLFGASDFALVVFDPNGRTGEPFAKRITAHAAVANTATIDATAIYGTARAVPQGTPWRLTDILDQDGNGSGLIGYNSYGGVQDYTTSSTSGVDVDATNMKVSFVAPPSGKVLVRLTAVCYNTSGVASGLWGLREGGADLTYALAIGSTSGFSVSRNLEVSGLTPGAAKTYKWAFKVNGGTTHHLITGGDNGIATMEVLAVNV